MADEDKIRSALEAAYDAAAPPQEPKPVEGDAAPATPAQAAPAAEVAEVPAADKPSSARGPDGKFLPKEVRPEGVAAPEKPIGAPAEKPAPVATAAALPNYRAPANWKPAAREAFARAPREVQEEALRREKEIAVALTQSGESRHFQASFQQAMTPYAALLGGNPVQAIQGIVQTAHALATASPQGRAEVLARLIKGYGVPVEALATALDDPRIAAMQPAQLTQPQSQPVDVERAIDTLLTRREASRLKAEFDANPPEFYEDVRPIMASVLDAGLANTLQEAYEIACQHHPEIKGVVAQRAQAEAAKKQQAATQKAREAASSVKSQPGGQLPPQVENDWRGALEKAWK